MAFQRRKSEAIGVKAALPGFIEPALASSIDKVPAGDRWITRSSSMATASKCIWPTRPSGSSLDATRLDASVQEGLARRLVHQSRNLCRGVVLE